MTSSDCAELPVQATLHQDWLDNYALPESSDTVPDFLSRVTIVWYNSCVSLLSSILHYVYNKLHVEAMPITSRSQVAHAGAVLANVNAYGKQYTTRSEREKRAYSRKLVKGRLSRHGPETYE